MTNRLTVGDLAPDFTLPVAGGGSITLSDLHGSNVVVYFYPAASTPGCTTQACDFRDNLASLTSHGYQVIGISPDAVAKIEKFVDQETLTFPLASDEFHTALNAYGAYGEKNSYGKTVKGVIRSTFVINGEGVITQALYNVKATGHVARLRRDLGIDTTPAE